MMMTNRIFLSMRILHLQHQQHHLGAAICRAIHGTAIARGRHGGADALEPDSRPLSKKQRQRRRDKLLEDRKHVDNTKRKTDLSQMKQALSSEKMKKFMAENEELLKRAVRDLSLPDGFSDTVDEIAEKQAEGEGGETFTQKEVVGEFLRNRCKKAYDLLNRLRVNSEPLQASAELEPASSKSQKIPERSRQDSSSSRNAVLNSSICSHDSLRAALKAFTSSKRQKEASELMDAARHLGLSDDIELHRTYLVGLFRAHKHLELHTAFDALIADSNVSPDERMWALLITSHAQTGNVREAVAVLDRLLKLGIRALPEMYTSILNALVAKNRHENVKDFWWRMHTDMVPINKESFTVMIKFCAKTGEAERAVFYLDEMKALGLRADAWTYVSLFRACAEAPHWVRGYEDYIFDIMCRMEGDELYPTTDIYNSIIYAFSRACDAAAAEFYFIEMKRKGLPYTEQSYNSLLNAYARNQSVGVRPYGYLGRYVRPAPTPKSPTEEAMVRLGPEKSAEIISRGLEFEGDGDRRSKHKGELVDDDDFGLFASSGRAAQELQLELEELESEARRTSPRGLSRLSASGRQKRETSTFDLKEATEIDGSDFGDKIDDDLEVDFEAFLRGDKKLQKLISGLKPEDVMRVEELFNSSKVELDKQMEDENFDPDDYLASLEDGEDSFGDGDNGTDDADEDFYSNEDQKVIVRRVNGTRWSSVGDVTQNLPDLLSTSPFNKDPPSPLERESSNSAKRDQKSRETLVNVLDNGAKGLDPAVAEALARTGRSSDILIDSDGLLSMDRIDKEWEVIEFGRAPKPDYKSKTLDERYVHNITRAEQLFHEMHADGRVCPDIVTLNTLLSVYGEALDKEGAYRVLDKFSKYGYSADSRTYRHLIRMHVRAKDVKGSLALKEEMENKGLSMDKESYGLLVESLTRRNNVVESLKMIEEAAVRGIQLSERHLSHIRARCEKLQLRHPDIPDNPNAWVKAVKMARKEARSSTSLRRLKQLGGGIFD